MKTIFFILAFGCCSIFASAQSNFPTDTSKGISTYTSAMLHYHFFGGSIWVEFENGSTINLKQDLKLNPPKQVSSDTQNMLLCLAYMKQKGFHFAGTFYQINDGLAVQSAVYILEKK